MRGQCSCGTLQHKTDCLMLCLKADSSTSAAHQMMRLTCRARVGQQHTAAAHSSSTQQHSSSTQQHTATAHSSSTQQNTAAHSRTHTVSRLTTMVTQCVYKNGANLQCSILLQLHVCSGNNINIKGKHSCRCHHSHSHQDCVHITRGRQPCGTSGVEVVRPRSVRHALNNQR